jgi:sugar phosphate isomerase/epimerase
MQIVDRPPVHLTYSLNVHAGEGWDDQVRAIREVALEVRRRVTPSRRFGLGLRLGRRAADELAEGDRLAALRALLDEHGLYVFTINGFPYGPFHGQPVKENVYAPDWRTPERMRYTCDLADLLAELLPEGVEGSISTAPGSYKPWIRTDGDVRAMTDNLADCARHLADIETRTGRLVHLGLEPEPDCFVETTAEAIGFFETQLWSEGARRLSGQTGRSDSDARDTLARHLGVCLDTCHLALQFEDVAQSIDRLRRAGVRISKMQISAALKTVPTGDALARLKDFCDPVYLHQVKTQEGGVGAVRSLGDLEEALNAQEAPDSSRPPSPWRIHCHVPLYFESDGPLESTATELTPAVFRSAVDAGVRHLEMETYTFNVLPETLRGRTLTESLVEEYRWTLSKIAHPFH